MKVDINRCQVWQNTQRGILFYTAYSDQWVSPLGMVWGIAHGENAGGKSLFEVYGSHTIPEVRRQGVRAFINRFILDNFDVVITSGGSAEGKLFMAADGYVVDRRTGLHVKTNSTRKVKRGQH